MGTNLINTELQLPCGVRLKNRLVKAAMTERISDGNSEPTVGHERLYADWAKTGAGLLITGNIMIDKIHLESAGNVCIESEKIIPKLKSWSNAGKKNGNHIWVQLSHAGRQSNRFNAPRPLAPSEVQLKKNGLFGKPKAMSEKEIQNTIDGFIKAAKLSKKGGFTGVQIHAAHGYLINQFLSPHTNRRNDIWGGNAENRSRFLLTIVREVRKVVGPKFPVSVKLNSSDFQRGRFTEEDSLAVIKMLDIEKIDLLEISGGTYEKAAFLLMNDEKVKESTRSREAFFIDFAKKVKSVSEVPLMVTGGFRSFDFCNEVLTDGELDLVGMARPFITNRDKISKFIHGEIPTLDNLVLRTGFKRLEDAAEAGFHARQIIRYSKGKELNPNMSAFWSANFVYLYELRKTLIKKLS